MASTRPVGQSYIIKRPRLTKLLDESEARIILLCAPAGYGKTTLAREWVATRSEPVAWYRGGPEMLDVAAVAQGLAESFAPMTQRDLPDRIAGLAARNQSPVALGRALAAGVADFPDLLIAVDDYHLARASNDSEALISALVEHSTNRILLASRSRPSWLTSRMTVYGEALAIDHIELAFTHEEAIEVLTAGGAPKQEAILENARGWPAVIGLAAFRSGARADIAEKRVHAELYEYFAEALFRDAPANLQRALFALALCGEHSSVATDVIGRDIEVLLTQAVDRGFVTRTSEGTVDVHPLLRSFLLGKLQASRSKEDLELVIGAVNALGAAHLWDEYLAVMDIFPIATTVAELLRAALGELLATGRVVTVKRWLELAERIGTRDPVFLLAEAEIALREADDSRAQTLAARAGKLLGDTELAARAYVVAARAAHLRGDNDQTKKYVLSAKKLPANGWSRTEAIWLEFLAAIEEQDSRIYAIVDELGSVKDASAEHALRLQTAEMFIQMEIVGHLRQTARSMEVAEGLLAHVYDPLVRSTFMHCQANCALCLSEYDRALFLTQRQIDDALASGLEFAADYALVTRAGAYVGLRQLAQAKRLLHQLESKVDLTSGHLAAQVALKTARLRATSGDTRRAEILLRPEPPPGVSKAFAGERYGTRAVLLAALDEVDEAKRAMHSAWEASASADGKHLADLAMVILALRGGEQSLCESPVAALAHVVKEGHLDDVVFASRVCVDVARAGASDPYVRSELTRVLANSNDIDLGRAAGLEMPRELRRQEGLTPREREVYELLVEGRSNRAIAQTLFISESTTKVHVHHIYEKLGVHSRAEAAAASHKPPKQ